MSNRALVRLRNFSEFEADCKCGCGLPTSPELLLRIQAFIYILERHYDCPVRCIITGGARCIKHNTAEYKGVPTPSYHCGISKGAKKDWEGAAVDMVMEIQPRKDWARITKAELAKQAIDSKLFGGIGWKKYGSDCRFLHVDLGSERTF